VIIHVCFAWYVMLTLWQILPSKVDPLVSLMRVEKVPDSTYETLGGLEKQVYFI
jgi:ATP-dependent 26S proteasome regulatory subunit